MMPHIWGLFQSRGIMSSCLFAMRLLPLTLFHSFAFCDVGVVFVISDFTASTGEEAKCCELWCDAEHATVQGETTENKNVLVQTHPSTEKSYEYPAIHYCNHTLPA